MDVHIKFFENGRPITPGGNDPVYGDWDIPQLCAFLDVPTSDYTIEAFSDGLLLSWPEGRALCHEKGCAVQNTLERS